MSYLAPKQVASVASNRQKANFHCKKRDYWASKLYEAVILNLVYDGLRTAKPQPCTDPTKVTMHPEGTWTKRFGDHCADPHQHIVEAIHDSIRWCSSDGLPEVHCPWKTKPQTSVAFENRATLWKFSAVFGCSAPILILKLRSWRTELRVSANVCWTSALNRRFSSETRMGLWGVFWHCVSGWSQRTIKYGSLKNCSRSQVKEPFWRQDVPLTLFL